LLKKLPQTSPYRIPLLHFITESLPYQQSSELFNLSKSSYQRSKQTNGEELFHKSRRGIKRQRIEVQDIADAKLILDDIAPVASGRNYRIKNVSDQQCYEQ